MISGCDFFEGATRMRCVVFAAHKTIPSLSDVGFYDDWAPSKFGPLSERYARDLKESLGRTIGKWPVRNGAGHLVDRYGLMAEGEKAAKEAKTELAALAAEVQDLARQYARAPLMLVQHDLLTQFPQYWLPGKIRSEVVSRMAANETPLASKFDEIDES